MKPPDEHISHISTVVPYYILAAVSFVIFQILLIISLPEIHLHYFQPKLLALTHLFVLGWGTMVIFGAVNQLVPVIAETKLYSQILPVINWILLTIGIPILIWSFWTFQFIWITYTGASLIIIAIILHAFNIYKSIFAGKSNIIADILLMAHAWLFITGSIGLLLLINLISPLFPEEHLHYLKIHAPIGMAGWFLQLIIGVSARLVPMFMLSRRENTKLLSTSFYTLNAGLALFLIEGMIFHSFHGRYIYLLLVIVGLAAYATYIRGCYKSALRKQKDAGMRQTFIAIGFILAALVLLIISIWVGTSVQPQITTLFGLTFFCGLVTIIIMGQTFKTLPFIVWMHITKPNALPELMPKDLFSEQWVNIQLWVYLPGLLLLLTGLAVKLTILLQAGAFLMLIAAIIYTVHVLYVTGKLKTKQL
ncbi:MAG TPA: hypothetical protein VIN07_01250 [Flavipsychrobacter sp.]